MVFSSSKGQRQQRQLWIPSEINNKIIFPKTIEAQELTYIAKLKMHIPAFKKVQSFGVRRNLFVALLGQRHSFKFCNLWPKEVDAEN
jgi:hypothetical protein